MFFCRKNLASLTEEETQRLEAALQRLIDSGKFMKLASFHGDPQAICKNSSNLTQPADCCPHMVPLFLPWHRLFTAQMEEELDEAIPYWEWTHNLELPSLWSGLGYVF